MKITKLCTWVKINGINLFNVGEFVKQALAYTKAAGRCRLLKMT